MKKNIIFRFLIINCWVLSGSLFSQNTMHPTFQGLDSNGQPIGNNSNNISYPNTCGACHDTQFIKEHTSHKKVFDQMTCATCHIKDADKLAADKMLTNEGWAEKDLTQRITRPTNNMCQSCHGMSLKTIEPLEFNDKTIQNVEKYYLSHLGISQGAFYSAQKIDHSHMNIEGKIKRNSWDVHAQRGLECISCHHSENSPRKTGTMSASVDFLKYDIRKEKSMGEYLLQPSHNLNAVSCKECHQVEQVHKFLPYTKRHLEVVACESCHIPEVKGAIAKTVIESVPNEDGKALVEFWNNPSEKFNSSDLNTKITKPFKPVLLQKDNKIAPYNVITNEYWYDTGAMKKISVEIISKLIFSNDSFKQQYLGLFDTDNDHKVSMKEGLYSDSQKIEFMQNILKQNGYENPILKKENTPIALHHGVVEPKEANKDCNSCHGTNSNLNPIALQLGKDDKLTPKDGTPFVPNTDTYVIGFSRIKLLDIAGILGFVLTFLGLAVHAGLRFFTRKYRKSDNHHEMETVTMYGRYERLWHWTLALTTIFLLLTGLEIHYSSEFRLFGLSKAVIIHNVSALLFFVNAVVSFLHFVLTRKIQQFIPEHYQLTINMFKQIRYYSYGIFFGEPHPGIKNAENKFNPLQQFTYLGLLNVLLPFQIVSGILMWAIDKWEFVSQQMHGYNYIAPAHTAGSWAFLTFLIMHIYLTTTGHSLFSNIQAMLTGEEAIEKEANGGHHG